MITMAIELEGYFKITHSIYMEVKNVKLEN